MDNKDKEEWMESMEAEINQLKSTPAYKLVKLPVGRQTIGSHWHYKVKLKPNRSLDKRKSHLFTKGFHQR